MDVVVVYGPRLCCYNLSGDKLSTTLNVEVVSPKILVDIKLYSNFLNSIDDVVVDGPRLCGYNVSGDRLSIALTVEEV